MPIKANIRDFLPTRTPKGQAWFSLPREERDRLLTEAKSMMHAYIEQRKIDIAVEKEVKKATQRTCQICGRGIFANIGLIAHHGYERPGDGWQTASCRGARQLPYETAHDQLDIEITFVADRLKTETDLLRRQLAEEVSFGFKWVERAERNKNPSNAFAGFRFLGEITRLNWDMLKADPENREAFSQSYVYNFDQLKERIVSDQEDTIDSVRAYLKSQQQRRADWVHKEDWNAEIERWVAVAVKVAS